MDREQESIFSPYIDAFIAQRVEELTATAEKSPEYIKGQKAIQKLIDKAEKVMDSEGLETLISAVRGTDIPIYEYIYRIGLQDGIWISDHIEQLKKRKK
ncbi:MAG: hypothetical protein IJ313_03025 [Clostridia bacterium]|nr:hypothetical protein [Clostridia bacterium]